MTASVIEPDWEFDRDKKREAKRRRRRIRKRLAMGDGDSRPSFMWRGVSAILGKVAPSEGSSVSDLSDQTTTQKASRQQRAQLLVERILSTVAWLALGLVVAFAGLDATRSDETYQSVLYGHTTIGTVVVLVGMVCLTVIMLDMASYKPRLFAQCSGTPKSFFKSLAALSPTLEAEVRLINHKKAKTWRRAKELEQSLLAESSEFLVLDGIRTRIIMRVLQRLAALVASLALVGYGLSAATAGNLLNERDVATGAGLADHAYFTLVAFFAGFGDIHLAHNAVGYGYLAVSVVSFTAVVYFFLTEVIASQSEFRMNIQTAAESFVLQRSKL